MNPGTLFPDISKLKTGRTEIGSEGGSGDPNKFGHNTQEQQVTETIVRTERKIGRNERVTIKNVTTGANKEVKYKQAIPLINKGEWVLVGE